MVHERIETLICKRNKGNASISGAPQGFHSRLVSERADCGQRGWFRTEIC